MRSARGSWCERASPDCERELASARRGEYTSVVIEADGGSRGNPGPGAYGAVLRDGETGEVIAHDGATLGRVTNNVAEYRGLIAGLELAREFAPRASVEARMDSKLVVEQMSGNWRIKHPDLQPLAQRAGRLAPTTIRYTWVPRAQNTYADRLANQALDGEREGVEYLAVPRGEVQDELELPADHGRSAGVDGTSTAATGTSGNARGWSGSAHRTTTLVIVRHGITEHTRDKRFSGGLASANPGLVDEGRDQVRASAEWLRPVADEVAAVVASPVRRTVESGEIVAEVLGAPLRHHPGIAEMEFGSWDGLTFGEVARAHRAEMDAWLGSLDVVPGGNGESFRTVQTRVRAALADLLAEYAGRTVVLVSHVTPIKILVADALGAPLDAVFKMELAPASVSVISHFHSDVDEDRASLRLFNARPSDAPLA